MNKIDEIKSLISELNLASIAYHRDDSPIMTDKEYDVKYDKLELLEKETGIIFSNSPTQKVQGMILESLQSIKHTQPMYHKVAYTPTAMFRLIDKENELRRLGEFDTCIEEHEKEYKFGKQDKDFTPLKSEFVVCVN